MSSTDYHAHNRTFWNNQSDSYQKRHEADLSQTDLEWGVWSTPESELGALAGIELDGADVLELGCGAAQWSIRLARRGARCTGIDLSTRQLEHAQVLVDEAGVTVNLVEGPAEALPFEAASFDLVLSDYGASMFADPLLAVPEVARVLRSGGHYVFSTSHPFAETAWPAGVDEPERELSQNYFEIHRINDHAVVFNLPMGRWIDLFAENDLVVERCIEPRPDPTGGASTYRSASHREWASQWPAEIIWRVRKL